MKRLKGSFTIEAAFVIPLILFLFVILMYIFFYYHDKNVLIAGVQEAAVYGCGRNFPKEQEVTRFLEERVGGKLLMFSEVEHEVQMKKDIIVICCKSESKGMRIEAYVERKRLKPEHFIRNIRKLEKLGEKVEEIVKDAHQE